MVGRHSWATLFPEKVVAMPRASHAAIRLNKLKNITRGVLAMKRSSTDWRHLSFVEAASAIEVLEIAHNKQIEASVQRRILEHVVEEYQHADVFKIIAKYVGQSEFRGNSAKKLVEAGGLGQGWSAKKSALYRKLALVEIGEVRALKALNDLKAKHDDERIIRLLAQIERDERGHAAKVSRYNARHWLQIMPYRLYYALKFFFQDISQRKMVSGAFGKLTRIFFGLIARLPLQKVAVLPEPVHSRRTAIEDSKISI
jgi:rubrerythrin